MSTLNLNRRDLFGLMAGAALPRFSFGAADERPNILYIMADDHAAHAISAYGSKVNKTPNIDRIATGGMRMKNCFCTNSICSPSRGVILTGEYSHMTGIKTLADGLPADHQNIGKLMSGAGYQTGFVGKWHLHNGPKGSEPTGFDYWTTLPGQGVYHDPSFIQMSGERKKFQGYATDLIADFSLDFLKKRDKQKPFFLMSHHKAPHRPWEPDDKHAKMYENEKIPEPFNLLDHYEHRSHAAANSTLKVGENMNRTDLKRDIPADLKGDALRTWAYQYYMKDYLRCIASVDDNVGRMLDYLDAEGLAKNTIVIYTSDQGFFLGDHGFFDKRFMYEESLRMPFLVRYPKAIKAGTTNDDIVLNLDFAETFLDYAHAKIPSDMQGRSFRPVLEGHTPKDWRKSMYYRYWMHMSDHGVPAHYGVRTKKWKLIYYYGKALGSSGTNDRKTGQPYPDTPPEWELFDMEKDPHEMYSLYGDPKYAGVVKELTAEMNRLMKLYKDTPA